MAQVQQNLPQRPMNIFDVINENVNVTNQNVITLIERVDNLQKELVSIMQMFKAPEQPNAPGDEGADGKIGSRN